MKRIRGTFVRDLMDTRKVADEFAVLAKDMKQSRLMMSAGWESKEPNFEWTLIDRLQTNLDVRTAILSASEQRLRDAVDQSRDRHLPGSGDY
jgi:hypothetical protein